MPYRRFQKNPDPSADFKPTKSQIKVFFPRLFMFFIEVGLDQIGGSYFDSDFIWKRTKPNNEDISYTFLVFQVPVLRIRYVKTGIFRYTFFVKQDTDLDTLSNWGPWSKRKVDKYVKRIKRRLKL